MKKRLLETTEYLIEYDRDGNTYTVDSDTYDCTRYNEALKTARALYNVENTKNVYVVETIKRKESVLPVRKDQICQFTFPEYKCGSNGCNEKIKCHILEEVAMRELGFSDYNGTDWYYDKKVYHFKDNFGEITFSLSINKKDENDWRIDVLDEDYGQPYDYQAMLQRSHDTQEPYPPAAMKVWERVEDIMDWLNKKGIITGHTKGEYI